MFAGACWQLIRFSMIGLMIISYLNPEFFSEKSLLILWSASSQLTLAAAFFFIAVDPARYLPYRNIILFGKIFDILPGIGLLALQAAAVFFQRGTPLFVSVSAIERITMRQIDTAVVFYYVLIGIIVIDFVFMMFLISYKYELPDSPQAVHDNLPEIEETQIEDE